MDHSLFSIHNITMYQTHLIPLMVLLPVKVLSVWCNSFGLPEEITELLQLTIRTTQLCFHALLCHLDLENGVMFGYFLSSRIFHLKVLSTPNQSFKID